MQKTAHDTRPTLRSSRTGDGVVQIIQVSTYGNLVALPLRLHRAIPQEDGSLVRLGQRSVYWRTLSS